MNETKQYRRLDMVFDYGHTPMLRRSGMSKKSWDYICHKFGVTQVDSERVLSISIDGEDDYGRLLISATIEEDPKHCYDDNQDDWG